MREKREQEKEKSETPKRNKKKKSDTNERKSKTPEGKFNCLAKASEVRKVLLAREPLYLLYCKDNKFFADNYNEFTISVSSTVELLLQEFKDVFPREIPHGLPPSRGIEHKIDLLLKASFPNRPIYKSNPQEIEEIHKQVQDLMQKGWVQESLSPCVVLVILVPKKDGTWRMCTNC